MKIALVSEHASPLAALGSVDAGGQNVHVAALAGALAKLGHGVIVYTRRDCATLPALVHAAPGVDVRHIDAGPPEPIPKDAIYQHLDTFAASLRRALEADCPDVVHSHFWMSGVASLAAARPLGLPVVHTYHALGVEKLRHQGAADTSPSARIYEERRIAREASRVVATASHELFELARMGANPRAVRVIPCGVDLRRFSPEGPREARDGQRFRLLTISRLVPRKGVQTVIESLAGLRCVELVVAGGGDRADLAHDPEVARLRAVAAAHGVAERVHFRGRVERDHLPALIRSADAVVCVPWYEPFGIVPLEAMACGVPVVASSVGGLVDTVVDGVTGIHVAPRAPRQIARAVELLRGDPDLRRALGRAGYGRVRARYAWERVAAETLDVYRGVARRAEDELATGS